MAKKMNGIPFDTFPGNYRIRKKSRTYNEYPFPEIRKKL